MLGFREMTSEELAFVSGGMTVVEAPRASRFSYFHSSGGAATYWDSGQVNDQYGGDETPLPEEEIVAVGITPEVTMQLKDSAHNTAVAITILSTLATGGFAIESKLIGIFGEAAVTQRLAVTGAAIGDIVASSLLEDFIYQLLKNDYVEDIKNDGLRNLSHVSMNWGEYNNVMSEYNAWIESVSQNSGNQPEFGDPDWD